MRAGVVKQLVQSNLEAVLGDEAFMDYYKLELVEQGDNWFTLQTTLPDGRRERLRFDCQNYKQQLPAIYLVDTNGQRITTQWPPYPGATTNDGMGGMFFFCNSYNREYYVHSSHRNEDPNKILRGGVTLRKIIQAFMRKIHGR